MRQELRGVLVAELKRRGMWHHRPSFLGVVGHLRWAEQGTGSDALDELAADCFEFIFVRRLKSLKIQAERKANIDGLIRLGVRHFLIEAQRRNDPIGFRVFELLRDVISRSIAAGHLSIEAGNPRLRNDTFLAVKAVAAPHAARGAEMSCLADRWADERLEDLVTASRVRRTNLVAEMVGELKSYLGDERFGFRFGDLVDPLKRQVRNGWAARMLDLPGVLAAQERIEEQRFRDQQSDLLNLRSSTLAILRCMDGAVGDDSVAAKTRLYLNLLWQAIRGLADGSGADLDSTDGSIRLQEQEELPSHRTLAQLLGIPRARLPGLFERLRRLWRDCEHAFVSGKEGKIMDSEQSTSQHPRERAAIALRDTLARTVDTVPTKSVAAVSLEEGDLFVVPEVDVEGVQWLVLDTDPDAGLLRCVPMDACPLVGAHDLDLTFAQDEGEPRVVRLGLELWLDARVVGEVLLLNRLDATARFAADTALKSRESYDGELASYREELEDGSLRAHQALARIAEVPRQVETSGEVDGRPVAANHGRRSPWPRLAAAALAAGVIGLSWTATDLRRRVHQLEAPILDLPYREVHLTDGPRSRWFFRLPFDATHIQLVLVSNESTEYANYEIELVSTAGGILYETPALEPDIDYSITVRLQLFDQGPVTVRYYGVSTSGERRLLREKLVEIVVEEPP